MFRQFFRNFAIQKNICDDFLKIRYFTTAAPTTEFDEKYEYNHVELLGTIASEVRALPSGNKSIIIRTNDDRGQYQNHQVSVSYDEPMTIGQRIYVDGIVRSKRFTLDDGRSRHRVVIKSNCVQLRHPELNADDKDVNNVKMMAKICSEILHTYHYTVFELEAKYTPKREDGLPGTLITELHRVLIYDQRIRGGARNLKKFDRVHVEGKIKYTRHTDTSGKTLLAGFIVAQIIKPIEAF